VPASQPGNASLAALAQVMQQQQQQAAYFVAPGSPVAAAAACAGPQGFAPVNSSADNVVGGHTTYTVPFNTPAAAAAGSPGARHCVSPSAADRHAGLAVTSTGAHYGSSSAAASPAHKASEQCCYGSDRQGDRLTPQRHSGGLAGLVSELQSDVDKLQKQLHSTRRQLNWEGRPSSAVEGRHTGAFGTLHR
jgi:hypothetical protein